jgi:LCP family protein required for cell wall assembly
VTERPPAGDGNDEAPKPSTWAARQGIPAEPDAAPPETEAGPEPTEDSGEVEPDLGEGLDEELALEDEDLADSDEDEDGTNTQETVESDTLALADREEAQEAALAGVRARAAQKSAATTTAGGATTVQPAPTEKAAPEPAPAATPPPAQVPVPAEDEGSGERPLWLRFVAASLLIVVSMATATAVSLLVYLTGIAKGLGGLDNVRNMLVATDPGHPQNILILGSDKRADTPGDTGRSDTTMLLHVSGDEINLMSIPRDLRVNIPGHGVDKFNAAYTYGGPKLTLTVVKQLTGVEFNHVVNVDFNGFADAVNAIDCVYVDVDHHYYHSNLGLGVAEQYAEIDVPAGYQRMCGYNALQYVRYRHEDNDLVRAARQQDFLRDARQQLPPSKIVSDRNQLIDILKKYVTSDIEKPETVLALAKLFIAARDAPVRQIHFPAALGGPDAAYVTSTQSQIQAAVKQFLGVNPPPQPSAEPSKSGGSGSQKKGGGGSSKGGSSSPAPPPAPTIDATAPAQQYAATLAAAKTKHGSPMLDFPVYYPTRVAPDSSFSDDSRAFPIDGPGDSVYHGYKLVISAPTEGYTSYYGVSGTDWKDPPILANPTVTKQVGGRDYLQFWSGGALTLVGWKTDKASYWVDNTLLNVLSPGQMMAIAQSMQA